MDDLGAALQSFLSQPGAMEQVEAMAKQLGLGEAPLEAPSAPVPSGDSISPETLSLLMGALGGSGGDSTGGLFENLRPLFADGGQEKLDRAARAMRLMHTAKTLSSTLGTLDF